MRIVQSSVRALGVATMAAFVLSTPLGLVRAAEVPSLATPSTALSINNATAPATPDIDGVQLGTGFAQANNILKLRMGNANNIEHHFEHGVMFTDLSLSEIMFEGTQMYFLDKGRGTTSQAFYIVVYGGVGSNDFHNAVVQKYGLPNVHGTSEDRWCFESQRAWEPNGCVLRYVFSDDSLRLGFEEYEGGAADVRRAHPGAGTPSF